MLARAAVAEAARDVFKKSRRFRFFMGLGRGSVFRKKPPQSSLRGVGDTALGDEAGDQPRRRDVERRVRGGAALRRERDRRDASVGKPARQVGHLERGAALYRNL